MVARAKVGKVSWDILKDMFCVANALTWRVTGKMGSLLSSYAVSILSP